MPDSQQSVRLCPSARRVLLCLYLLSNAWASGAFAATVGGHVVDQVTNQPLAGARVRLQGVALLPAAADWREVSAQGRFVYSDLAPGEWTLELEAAGYRSLTVTLNLVVTDSLSLDFPLELDALVLEDLVVTGDATDIEQDLQTGYTNLDRETLAEIPGIIEDDPLRALQLLPGVQSASDISSGLYIRGGGPDQNLILMEGATVYNPTHAFGFFSTFNNDAVDNVSLFKGAYPAPYGGRLGGLVEVDMTRDTPTGTHGKVGLSLIAGRVFLSGQQGRDQWWVGARRSFLEPLLKAINTPENPIPQWYFYDTNFGYTSYRGGGVTRFLFYKGRDQVSVDADVDTRLDLGWGNTVASLRHERFLSDNVEARVILAQSRYDSNTDAEILATPFQIGNRLRDTSLTAQLDWRAGMQHRIVGGLGYDWYDFRYRQEFNRDETLDYRTRPGELSAFVEDNWFPDDLTTVRGGLRYRYLTDGQRRFWEPRLAASRQVKPDLRLKVGGGIYNQYLQLIATEGFSASDVYVPIDETATPGRSWQAVVGADWQASPGSRLSVETYTTSLRNLVVLDTNVPVDQASLQAEDLFVTGGKGYARGIEVFWRHKHEQWTGWVGYTLGWTRRTFAEINGGESFVPKYDRRHDLNLLLGRQAGRWRLTAAFRYATGQAFTPAAARYQLRDPATGSIDDTGQILSGARNSARLLPYHRLDVSARKPIRLFGLQGELVLEVFNLYNRRNEWFVQYNTDNELTEATVVRMLPLIPSVGVNLEF